MPHEVTGQTCDRCRPEWRHVACSCGWSFHSKPGFLSVTWAEHRAADHDRR